MYMYMYTVEVLLSVQYGLISPVLCCCFVVSVLGQ